MAKIPRDGSTVDLQPLFYQITLDTSTEFLFGESVDVLRSPAGSGQQLFGQALDYAQTELNFRLRLGPLIFLYRNKEFDRACTRVQNFVDKYVAKALEFRRTNLTKNTPKEDKRPGKYIFMNELALATDDPIQIRSELLNLLLAGRDTTAGLLSNTFYVLARRADIWAKLKGEVDRLEGRIPDYTALHQMKYVKNVLNECKLISLSIQRKHITEVCHSPSIIPLSTPEYAICQQEHYASCWWWTGRQVPDLCSERPTYSLWCVFTTSTEGLVRRRCR